MVTIFEIVINKMNRNLRNKSTSTIQISFRNQTPKSKQNIPKQLLVLTQNT